MASESDVKIVITAEDKASGTLSGISDKVGNLGGHLANFGKAALAGMTTAGTAIAAFGVSSFKAFAEAEKEMIIANQAVNNTLETMSADKLNKLQKEVGKGVDVFSAMEKKVKDVGEAAIQLGFDDEEASVAFAKLYQVSEDTTQAQNDLKLAMDLSAFSGRGLGESAMAITKVHSGATRVLKEFGIEVQEGTTAMDALNLMQQRTQGSAEAMAKSSAKQLEILGIQWTNLKETVGGALAEAIAPFISQLSVWAASPDAQEKIKAITDALVKFITFMKPVVETLLPILNTLLNATFKVVSALAKFIFVDFANALGTVIFKFTQMVDAIKSAVDWIAKLINKISEFSNKYISSPLANIGKSFQNLPVNLGIPGFAQGGVVPGAIGAPQLAVVHGGETVIPVGGSRGAGMTFNFDLRNATLTDVNFIKRVQDAINKSLAISAKTK